MHITKATVVAIVATPLMAVAAGTGGSVEERLRALEERQTQLEQQLEERDARIQQLEAQVKAPAVPGAAAGTTAAATVQTDPSAAVPVSAAEAETAPTTPARREVNEENSWGRYEGGKGVVLARSEVAEVDFSVFTYVRYLNQLALDETYTDAFGRTKTLDLRNDAQFQKVTLNFKGWLFNPDFRYLFYTWTANTSQGQSAQVVVAGNLSYHFSDTFSLAGGIGPLPTTQSTNYTFPSWLRVDNRTIADEFFRGSYTSGFWAWGKLSDEVGYRLMLGSNLSQLGVDAVQMDNTFNTVSGALWWMPTTGEYGPAQGLGDFEYHDDPATLFSAHYTRSREDRQSQPGADDFENTQIRLSDGTIIFAGVRIRLEGLRRIWRPLGHGPRRELVPAEAPRAQSEPAGALPRGLTGRVCERAVPRGRQRLGLHDRRDAELLAAGGQQRGQDLSGRPSQHEVGARTQVGGIRVDLDYGHATSQRNLGEARRRKDQRRSADRKEHVAVVRGRVGQAQRAGRDCFTEPHDIGS